MKDKLTKQISESTPPKAEGGKIFISAGEPSGDIHGSNLMLEVLKREPGAEFYGLGRHRMVEAGLRCLHPMDNHSVMWAHILGRIPTLWQIYQDCKEFFKAQRPSSVVLIDYAGFNFYLAQAASRLDIPVLYYISPQLWAHGAWRVKKLKRMVKKVLVIYPFEEDFYSRAGIPVRYVGHPLFDELAKRTINTEMVHHLKEKGKNLISLLPGSREQEVAKLLPIFLKAAQAIQKKLPQSHFTISCPHVKVMPMMESQLRQSGVSAEIVLGHLSELIAASDLCITGSGTVTLEIAAHLRPMVIAYRITPFAYFVARPYMETPYLSLVNKMAESHLVPERLMYRDDYQWIADRAVELILDKDRRDFVVRGLEKVKGQIGTPGASARAAQEVLQMMKGK